MQKLHELARLIRYYILISTTAAGSGHPSSSLSATDFMTALLFGGFFRADINRPDYINNDRLIFSKGHAAPLLYALYAAAGKVSETELLQLRKFESPLEGHPSLRFPYTEVATGSLGQGLSVGVGMALNAKYLDKVSYRTFVLLGDSEMAEGSIWEAMEIAAHYKLNNLVAIVDVNRLGQRGETLFGHHIDVYQKKAEAFGWKTMVVEDGNDITQCVRAFEQIESSDLQPIMILARTFKGKGVSFIENKEGWHGKPLNEQQLEQALQELGPVQKKIHGRFAKPEKIKFKKATVKKILSSPEEYKKGEMISTRKAYGDALVKIFSDHPNMVVLDAETSNSTFAETFKKFRPDKFFEMFIAEQNMAGVALGLSRRGKIPFVSTFAAFLTRAFDQIRMGGYSNSNVKFVGSHAGVSIGEDGPSQMALEDMGMFLSVLGSTVLYPSDAVSCEQLVRQAADHEGMVYIRTTRMDLPVLYSSKEKFPLGGHKVLRSNKKDSIALIGAGITVHEALKAQEMLEKKGISARVIDLYSIKPMNERELVKSLRGVKKVFSFEDHHIRGGFGETLASFLPLYEIQTYLFGVKKIPRSGTPQELLEYEEISAQAMVKWVQKILKNKKI